MKRPRPVLVTFAILAGAQVLLGGAALSAVVPTAWVGLGSLVVASVQAGMTFYVQGKVTPLSDPRDASGEALVPAWTEDDEL